MRIILNVVNINVNSIFQTIEFFPETIDNDKVLLLLSYNRIPTYKKYEFAVMAFDTQWKTDGGKNIGF